jgi:FtsH-binding integral membrane protein
MYTPESVLLSAVATLAATLGVTFYALTTKTDFTSMGNSVTGNFINKKAFGFALFNILFWVSLVNIFLVQSPFATLAIAWGMGIVYTIYLIVDTQMVLGGKNKSLTLDNYALGAMIIYADIIQLFLQILKILGKKKRE